MFRTLLPGRMRMSEDSIGVGEAARILDVSPQTIRNLIKKGQLTARRKIPSDPRSWRVLSRKQVEALRDLPPAPTDSEQ